MLYAKNDIDDLRSAPPEAGPSPSRALGELCATSDLLRLFPKLPALANQPRGSGEPVTVLPGFAASDRSTAPLRTYLRYLGYRAEGWKLGTNRGDVPALIPQVVELVSRRAQAEGHPIRLVGWSLGGYLAREAARDVPEHVAQVITLGSPIVGGPRFTTTASFYKKRGTDFEAIDRAIQEREQAPIRVPISVIYSKSDGVVEWRACIDRTSPDVEHFRVTSTHIGLGVAPEVLSIVASELASRGRLGRRTSGAPPQA